MRRKCEQNMGVVNVNVANVNKPKNNKGSHITYRTCDSPWRCIYWVPKASHRRLEHVKLYLYTYKINK